VHLGTRSLCAVVGTDRINLDQDLARKRTPLGHSHRHMRLDSAHYALAGHSDDC
jgi:hypothetical protein